MDDRSSAANYETHKKDLLVAEMEDWSFVALWYRQGRGNFSLVQEL